MVEPLWPINTAAGSRHGFVACLNHREVHVTTLRSIALTVIATKTASGRPTPPVKIPLFTRVAPALSLSHLSTTIRSPLCPLGSSCVLREYEYNLVCSYTTDSKGTPVCVFLCESEVWVWVFVLSAVCCASWTVSCASSYQYTINSAVDTYLRAVNCQLVFPRTKYKITSANRNQHQIITKSAYLNGLVGHPLANHDSS